MEAIGTNHLSESEGVLHQIDHMFVDRGLKTKLDSCEVPPATEIFDAGLSDHLPIVSTFRL